MLEPVSRAPNRPAEPTFALGALQSQIEVQRVVNPAAGLRAVVAWAQRWRPAELFIPLRTGLPCWLGFQALQRGWPVAIVVAPDTLDRSPDDVQPLLFELVLGAARRIDVGSWRERDELVRSTVPILGIEEILRLALPKIDPHAV